MDYEVLADKALGGQILEHEEMLSILNAPDEKLPELLQAAFRVRRHFWGKKVQIHVLKNIKSGLCPEDCHYCSQSSISKAPIDKYPLLSKDNLLEGAIKAKEAGAVRYCMVASGRGPTERETDKVAEVVRRIKSEVPINICACLGLLDDAKAKTLKQAGVERVNHNLNTSRRHHPNICTTHTYDDRVATVNTVRQAGMSTCCGGIMGMGETQEDVIAWTLALRQLNVDSIPVNFLHAIPGTPLANRHDVTPQGCLKILCLVRFANPSKEVRVGGGREVNLRWLQPLSLYPANSIFVNGYLTTPGQKASDAHQMIADLGFEIAASV